MFLIYKTFQNHFQEEIHEKKLQIHDFKDVTKEKNRLKIKNLFFKKIILKKKPSFL